MSFDDDITAIVGSGDFDTEAKFTLADDSTVCIRGIFTDATQGVNSLTNEIETVMPTFACPTDCLSRVKRGDSVEHDGETYTVERKERLGTGFSLVHLKT